MTTTVPNLARRMVYLFAQVPCAVAAVILFSGCVDNGSPDTFRDATVTVSEPVQDLRATSAIVPTTNFAASDVSSRIFKLPVNDYLIPDPHHADEASQLLTAEVYSGLMRFEESEQGTNVTEDLATRYTLSEDGLVYRFYLKPGLAFSDGSPVDAADFKWSWERALRINANQMALNAFQAIEGARDYVEGKSQEVTGVQVVDHEVLEVRVAETDSRFPMSLALPIAVVLDSENVNEWGADYSLLDSFDPESAPFDFDELPVGTGAFMIKALDFLGRRTELARNPHHAHGNVWLDGVEFFSYGDAPIAPGSSDLALVIDAASGLSTLWGALESGEVHAFESALDPRPYSQNGYSTRWTVNVEQTGFVSRYLAVNDAIQPFDRLSVRRALYAAFNPALFVEITGNPVPLGIAPERMGGEYSSQIQPTWDPRTADEHMRDAGLSSPLVVPFEVPAGTLPLNLQHVFDQWHAVLGVETEFVSTSNSSYLRRLASGKVGLVEVEARADIPSVAPIYNTLLSAVGGSSPTENWANVSRLVDTARTEQSPLSKRTNYEEVDSFLASQALVIPLEWDVGTRFVVLPKWIVGYDIPSHYGSRLALVRFNQP